MANKILHLDISKDPKSTELSILPIIYGRVGDEDTQTVTIYTSKRDEEFELTNQLITFEGVLAGGKSKVFDTEGVVKKDLRKGIFEYTFPNRAFSVAGKYERAYFSFVKGKQRATTEDFQIIVLKNADITAEEAETVITEYNKLVKELQELQKKNIAELKEEQDAYMKALDQRVSEMKARLVTLEADIKKYEESVQKTATDAKNTISDALTEAVETIAEALEEFQNQNFYTKQESDTRFAKKTDLTKENVQLGNVDNYATANQTDAEQGIAGNKFMTPMGVNQHVTSRMATQEEVNEGKAADKLVSPKTLAGFNKANIPLEVYISHKSTVVELADVISGNKFPIGDIQSIDLFHTIDDLPFTLSSDKTTLTMKRDATLLIQQLQEGRGNSSVSYTDYFYFYFNGGTTRYDGIKYGMDAGDTAINLSHSGMAQCVMNLKAGDVIWTSVSTRSTDRKLWKGSVRGTYIKEMKSV